MQEISETVASLAEVLLRRSWPESWTKIESDYSSTHERSAFIGRVRSVGSDAALETVEKMEAISVSWDRSRLIRLIASEAEFRDFPVAQMPSLKRLCAQWYEGGPPLLSTTRTADGWSIDAQAVVLTTVLSLRWASEIVHDGDYGWIFGPELTNPAAVVLSRISDNLNWITPVCAQAGVSSAQMAYCPDFVLGWTVIEPF